MKMPSLSRILADLGDRRDHRVADEPRRGLARVTGAVVEDLLATGPHLGLELVQAHHGIGRKAAQSVVHDAEHPRGASPAQADTRSPAPPRPGNPCPGPFFDPVLEADPVTFYECG